MSEGTAVLDSLRTLTTAIQCGDVEIVEHYLKDGGNPNAYYGLTLLAQAVECGNCVLVKMLLDAGANPNCSGKSGKFPLYLAARKQFPGDLDVLQMLLDHGADVNMKYVNGNTALLESVWMNDVRKAAMLLTSGANMLEVNNGGDTSLHISALKGNLEMTKLLINAGMPVNWVKHTGRGTVPTTGIQPLHLTTFGPGGGFSEMAQVLLEAGADVNAATANGRTTLHYAAIRNAYRVVDLLLQHNCELDPFSMENDEHKTPLMKAIDSGNPTVAIQLLAAGATIETVDIWGTSPLIAAAYLGSVEIAKALIQYGCDIDKSMTNDKTLTPLSVSVRHPPHITLALVTAGAKVNSEVCNYFRAQLQMPESAHTPIFDWMLRTATHPTSLRTLCRGVIRRRLGQFCVRYPATGQNVDQQPIVIDKLESLLEHRVPKQICNFIRCQELDELMLDFPVQ